MLSNRTQLRWRPLVGLVLVLFAAACTTQELPPVNPYASPTARATAVAGPAAPNPAEQSPTTTASPTVEKLSLESFLAAAKNDRFLARPSFAPADAKYYGLINKTFKLNANELALLQQNGFVVSDRLAFEKFTTAYAYIYWKDLPVLVTTDSILQSIHKTYDDMLKQFEATILAPKLTEMLSETQQTLRASAHTNTDSSLAPLYADLDTYLSVALVLLTGKKDTASMAPEAETYIEMAQTADRIAAVELFGPARPIDYTLFKPRGHYTESEVLERYFRAMSWIAQVDFRVIEYGQDRTPPPGDQPIGDSVHMYNRDGTPKFNPEALSAAILLHDAIDKADQRSNWNQMDVLFSAFVGRNDNMALPDLERFMADAHVTAPTDITHHPAPDNLVKLLTTNDYGQQRIAGQLLGFAAEHTTPITRPLSFMLIGQRFTVDAYLTSNLTYDRLVVDGQKIQRPQPSPLDVMYALGNNRAATHLQNELTQYGYQQNLATLRKAVDNYDQAFWDSSIYNRWLGMLRTLNEDTTANNYPQSMRTAAWADKMLHTQLASWAQLRHDNILYVKQSVTGGPLCEYPAGYVEPYPAFYARVRDYARVGRQVVGALNQEELTGEAGHIREQAITYFEHLGAVAEQLQTMAEKELRLEPFTFEEEQFLRDITIRKLFFGCGGPPMEWWNGWYPKLFPWKDENPAAIADIHTNANNDPDYPALLPPAVLHVATGPVAVAIFIADTDEGPTMYVGPAFTYYEVVEEGYPPVRLTDEQWRDRLSSSLRPAMPEWANTFRLPVSSSPDYLLLPEPGAPITPSPVVTPSTLDTPTNIVPSAIPTSVSNR